MQAQKIVRKIVTCNRAIRGILLLGLTIILFIALFGLISTSALANGWHGKRVCSKTASAAFLACRNEVKDDYWIAMGNCYNLSKKNKQAVCFETAKEEYNDAKAECGDQLDARKELCEELGEAPYDPKIKPEKFVEPEDIGSSVAANPYFPLVEGNKWVYKGVGETVTVTVTEETIEILGVTCRVVKDVVTDEDGEEVENTDDWYAQDEDGNVWYFGEFSLAKEECEPEELCEGLYNNDGSWKAGYASAKPGYLVKRFPEVDDIYRQEFALGDAEDWAKVLSVDAVADVMGFSCVEGDKCVQTEEGTPLEPDFSEHKYYKPGIGLILEVNPDTGERVELVSVSGP